MKFYSPMPRVVTGKDHHDLIRRLFRRSAPHGTQRIDLITTTTLRIAVIDSGAHPDPAESEGDSVVHVLWQMDEANATITIAGESWSIAPGDTAAIPTGDEWLLSPNQLAILVVRRSHKLTLPIAPHHGNEQFTGYNRVTTYGLPIPLAIQRRKVTVPHTMNSGGDLILIGLYNNLALQHRSEIELMPQGEVRVIRAGHDAVTIVPNGLTYILAVPGM